MTETREDPLENSSSSAVAADPVAPFERAVIEVERLRSQHAPSQDIRTACMRADAEHQRLKTFLSKEPQTREGLERMLAVIRDLKARLWRLSEAQPAPKRQNHGRPHQGGKNGRNNHRPAPRPTVEIVYRRRGGNPSD